MSTILDLQRQRYSVRTFQDRPVGEDVLDEMLEVARLSPTGGNAQDWALGVITDRGLIARIATAAYNQQWIAPAPLLIVLCTRTEVGRDGDQRVIQKQRFGHLAGQIDAMASELYLALNMREHQTKIVGTAMALCALAHGIGSTWVSKFDVPAVAKLLNLSATLIPSEILVFGYPAGEGAMRPKKPLAELVFRNGADGFAPPSA